MTDDVIPGQTTIPGGEGTYNAGPCEWCGDPTTIPFVVEGARWGKSANGTRVLKKRAIVVPACRRHAREFGQIDDDD